MERSPEEILHTLQKSVWRGVTQSRLKGQQSEDQGKYNEAATRIFASFPP